MLALFLTKATSTHISETSFNFDFFDIAFRAMLEEIIFRQLLIIYLLRYFNIIPTIIISSFLFSIAHLENYGIKIDYMSLILKFLSGSLYAWVFIYSGRLIFPFVLHFLWNVIVKVFFTDTMMVLPNRDVLMVFVHVCLFVLVTLYYSRNNNKPALKVNQCMN